MPSHILNISDLSPADHVAGTPHWSSGNPTPDPEDQLYGDPQTPQEVIREYFFGLSR